MGLYEQNLAILKKKDGELAEVIDSVAVDPQIYNVFPAKNGQTSLRVQKEDGQYVQFHSAYDPGKEARRLAGSVDINKNNLLIVSGFGLGYHVTELLSHTSAGHIIVVLEADPAVFKAAMQYSDLKELLLSKRFILLVGTTDSLVSKLASAVDINTLQGMGFLDHRPSVERNGKYYDTALEIIRGTLNQMVLNQITVTNEAEKWYTNTLENLPEVLRNPGVEGLFGKFRGEPIILVSAGPSLDKNVEYLRLAKEKALIICVGTALRALLGRGIRPDIVVSIDPREKNFEHFKGLDVEGIYLVAEPTSHPGIFETYQGSKLICTYGNSIINWVEKNIGPVGRVRSGGSVATVALDLAVRLGGNPIVFMGQDLAFTGGRTHAGGTLYERGRQEAKDDDLNQVTLPGYFGGQVLTSRVLYSFNKWIENYIRDCGETRFINATEGGAMIEGAERMLFREVLFRYCREERQVSARLDDYYTKNRQSRNLRNARRLLEKLESGLRELQDLGQNTLKLVVRIAEEYGSLGETRKVLEGLQKLAKSDARVDRMAALQFTGDVLKPTLLKVKTLGGTAEGTKLRLISAKEIYSAITYYSKYTADLLNKALEALNRGTNANN
ncbi:MAG: hypothetical protein CVU89_05190 [Firmicutes bacterium HGW-Firmicutes-14]|nr:MAG: hypothetical protein CVU89_05190 [Firmicutes bacterium HGW-Firmicutes-14]